MKRSVAITLALAVILLVVPQATVLAADVSGTLSSTSAFTLDNTVMDPTASPVWPVATESEVALGTAPAILTTANKDRLTFGRESKFKLGTVEGDHTYVYLRNGSVSFETGDHRVYICAAGRLFVPPPAVSGKRQRGYVRLDSKPNTVVRYLEKAEYEEDGRRACDEKGLLSTINAAGGIISGTAASGSAISTAGIAAGLVAGGAAATSALLPGATYKNNCTDPAGCGFNPVAVSPIQP